jgi:putative transposase
LPLFAPDAVKDLFVEQVEKVRRATRFRLLAWVVMPEHVHLIIVPALPGAPVSDLLKRMKQPFARQVIARWRKLRAPILERLETRPGHYRFWQVGGGYDRNLSDPDELLKKMDYVDRNPVTRGLVENATDWRWSSARCRTGQNDGLPLDDAPF